MTNLAPHRTTILILHQDPLLSAGVATALRPLPAFQVFESTTGMAPAVADIVVADYRRALLLAEETGRPSLGPVTGARILALTTNDREVDIRRAIQAGVHGYLLIGGPLSELVEAMTTLANGGRFLSQPVAVRIANSISCTPLTPRENDVLRLVITGEANKAIARQLGIEVGTVKTHMSTIMSKLGVNSRMRAASIAVKRGLVGDGDALQDAPTIERAPLLQAAGMVC